MIKPKIIFLISIWWIVIFINTACYAAGAKRTQSTSGDKSPAANAGRDLTITYNDDVEGRIIDKLAEVARKCKNKEVTFEDLKPELEAIALYKKKAIPLITGFASNYIDTNIDPYDPNFLLNYRTKLTKTILYDALVYVIQKIYADDTDARSYIADLYANPYKSIKKQKEALLLGYYLWRFPTQDVNSILATWLKGRPFNEMDPIKKVMLRTYLNSNYTDMYVISPSKSSKAVSSEKYLLKELGFEKLENGDNFSKHLTGYFYESLEDMDSEIGVRALVIPYIKKKLGEARGVYLYGLDFYDISVKNLVIDNVLLGKSFFDKAEINNIAVLGSTILDCAFTDAIIHNGWFDGVNFIGTKLDELMVTWGVNHTVIANAIFKETKMSNTRFVDVEFVNVQFDNCKHAGVDAKTTYRSSLLINAKFTACDPNKLVFDYYSIVDEQTLKSISNLPGFNKSNYVVKEINVNKDIINSYYERDHRAEDVDNSLSVARIINGLNSLKRKQEYYDYAISIIDKQKMFKISSINNELIMPPENKYAHVVSMIEKCGELYPDDKIEFEKAKLMLDKFIEPKKDYSGVTANPNIKSIINDAKLELNSNMSKIKNTNSICEKLKRGKFSILDKN